MERTGLVKLKEKSRIGIIGGGPAGTFCANFLLYFSRKENLPVEVTIYEGKVFEAPGVKGCNLCVGILANSLIEKLSSIGLEIPGDIIQRKIESYKLITEIGELTLEKDERRKIYTVYRGGGPKGFKFIKPISFDNFLLRATVDRGAVLRKCTIREVRRPSGSGEAFKLIGECGRTYEEDIIVGAFGVNSLLKFTFANMGIGYKPPKTITAYQAEFFLGEKFISENLHNTVRVYLLPTRRMDFGLIVPKKSQVTVSVVGRKLRKKDVDAFLDHPLVRRSFPRDWRPGNDYCFCAPHLPVGSAVKPYDDRIVIIGDGSISRYYKNGIQSAYFTALFAARTIFYHGTDKRAFRKYYWKWCRRKYFFDNMYGRSLFFGSLMIKRFKFMTKIVLNVAAGKWATNKSNAVKLRKIYWNMFTGNAPYYFIFRDLCNLRLQVNLLRAAIKVICKKEG